MTASKDLDNNSEETTQKRGGNYDSSDSELEQSEKSSNTPVDELVGEEPFAISAIFKLLSFLIFIASIWGISEVGKGNTNPLTLILSIAFIIAVIAYCIVGPIIRLVKKLKDKNKK